MVRRRAFLALLLLLPGLARAQCIGGTTTTSEAITVTTANTFQSVLASNSSRKGCLVQYTGTTLGYVFFGANGSATEASSVHLLPYYTVSCNANGGLIATDNISVTSATGSDTFVVLYQ